MPSVPSRWTTTRRKPVCWPATTRTAAASGACMGGASMGAGAGAACAGMLPAWALCSISRSVERFRGRLPFGRDRHRVGQPLFHQPGPTVLAKQHVAGVQVSATPALDHVEGFASSGILW